MLSLVLKASDALCIDSRQTFRNDSEMLYYDGCINSFPAVNISSSEGLQNRRSPPMPIELVGSFPDKNGVTGPYRRTMAFCQSQGERAKPVPKGDNLRLLFYCFPTELQDGNEL